MPVAMCLQYGVDLTAYLFQTFDALLEDFAAAGEDKGYQLDQSASRSLARDMGVCLELGGVAELQAFLDSLGTNHLGSVLTRARREANPVCSSHTVGRLAAGSVLCLPDLLYQTSCEVHERHIHSVHDLGAIWSPDQDRAIETTSFVGVGFLEAGLGVLGDHGDEGTVLEGTREYV